MEENKIPNQPITNPEVVEAMDAVKANETEETKNVLVNAVMRGKFLSPVVFDPEPVPTGEAGRMELKQGTQIKFNLLTRSDGAKILMAFTDREEFAKWPGEKKHTMVLTFDDYARMILDENSGAIGFAINPFSQNIVLEKQLVESLRNQKREFEKNHAANAQPVLKQVSNEGAKVRLGTPKQMPTDLLDAISEYLATRKEVTAAYMKLMEKNGSTLSHLIVINANVEDKTPIYEGIAKISAPYLKGIPVEMTGMETELGQLAAKDNEPFYKKKKFGLF